MTTQIFHNPRCSKSRQTLQLLEEKAVEHEVIRYLETPPDTATLQSIIDKLGITPRELLRKGEAVYKELGLADKSLSDAELIKAMVANPILIERPIVITDQQARIGRPPESVLEIL